MNDDSILVETKNVSKKFGGITAVEEVSLKVKTGELHCLIGPNGAGKSTFFKLLTGLLLPNKGQVFFKGKDITLHPSYKRIRLGISIKFQITSIYPELTVKQNLEIPWLKEQEGQRLECFEVIIETTDLHNCMHIPAKELPHGQLQWLEMSLALKTNPNLLLLDEPTAGMTQQETMKTAKLVKNLNERGITIIVVEHDMEFVKQIAQTVTVMHQGKLFAQGPLENIRANKDVQRIYLGEN